MSVANCAHERIKTTVSTERVVSNADGRLLGLFVHVSAACDVCGRRVLVEGQPKLKLEAEVEE